MTKKEKLIKWLNKQYTGFTFTIDDAIEATGFGVEWGNKLLGRIKELSYTDRWKAASRDKRVWRIEQLPIKVEDRPHPNKTGKNYLPITLSVSVEVKSKLKKMTPKERREVIERGLETN